MMKRNVDAERALDKARDMIYLANLEYNLQIAGALIRDCECCDYLLVNRDRLIPIFVETAQRHNREVDDVVSQFVSGVHNRHLKGLSLNA